MQHFLGEQYLHHTPCCMEEYLRTSLSELIYKIYLLPQIVQVTPKIIASVSVFPPSASVS